MPKKKKDTKGDDAAAAEGDGGDAAAASAKKGGKAAAKGGKGGKGKTKKVKEPEPEIDWADDEHFRWNEPMVYIEMDRKCFVFREQTDIFVQLLQAQFPATVFHVLVNSLARLGEPGPRDGSFEIVFAQNARCPEELLWSGLPRGPPRRLKFSTDQYQELWPTMRKIMMRYFEVPKEEKHEAVEEDDEFDF